MTPGGTPVAAGALAGWFAEDGEQPRLFEAAVAASLLLHAGFFFAVSRRPSGEVLLPDPIEIDLTKPLGSPAPLAPPKRLVPGAFPGPNIPTESTVPKPPVQTPAPQDWTLPTQETKKIEKLEEAPPSPGGVIGGEGTASIPGGTGPGRDDGVPGGTGDGPAGVILSYPKLLNRDEIFGLLQRYYPESERRAGREGMVVLALHITVEGKVGSADVLQSAGNAFDRAAGEVAKLMRFSPAMGRKGPVAVKLPQSVVFQLED
ncbi:MAG: TonB family protein [Elusimicrobia bacterium]|nr:TonB family protein [Elusimicrobiota bacterium]